MADLKLVPVFNGDLNTTAAIKIWQEILHNETKDARAHEVRWGHFKAVDRPMRPRPPKKKKGELSASSSAPSLKAVGMEVLHSQQRHTSDGPGTPASFEFEGPPSAFDQHFRLKRGLAQKVPKERYPKPVTTAQQVGWRKNLELFGVSEHGLTHEHELFPTM
mmetsp:Transcript_12888/g.30175  ORF Transcript_12888/g.30175 Transcript_12888/m.30175 type:complete len:162 (-) Transcript_12888:55-540(-)